MASWRGKHTSHILSRCPFQSKEIASLPAMPRPFKKLRDLDLVDVAARIEHALSE